VDKANHGQKQEAYGCPILPAAGQFGQGKRKPKNSGIEFLNLTQSRCLFY
jgi:hypothetical protein